MNEENIKYIQRTIERLESIYNSSTPWTVRERLSLFVDELKKLIPEQV